MKTILAIGHNDARVFFKMRSAYIWLFAVPLAFVYFMGFAIRGPGEPANRRPSVRIDNRDTGFLGRMFLDELGAQGLSVIHPANPAAAARSLQIPPDFTATVLQGKPAQLAFTQQTGSAETDATLVELRITRALIALNSHLIETIGATGSPAKLTEDSLRQRMAAPDPVTLDARFAGRNPMPSGFNFSLPGNLVMYLMMNLLIFGGNSLAVERRNGVLKRLLLHPVRHIELVMGKICGLMLLGAAQILFFLAAGRFLFHVNLGANLPGVTLTLLVFAWVAGSLGVLIGSLVTSEDRVTGLCILVSLIMAALGGCWWPLEIGPPVCKTIALCLPTGWAMLALHQLISFGSGTDAVLLALAVLLGFGVFFNALAIRLFRV